MHRGPRQARRPGPPHGAVIPPRSRDEMQRALARSVHSLRVLAGQRGERFDALALEVAFQRRGGRGDAAAPRGLERFLIGSLPSMPPPPKALRAPVLPPQLEPRTITTLNATELIEQCRIEGCALTEAA